MLADKRMLPELPRQRRAARLWTTDAGLIPLRQAQAPHEAETVLPPDLTGAELIPFSAQTRMSGIDLAGRRVRKAA